MIKIILIAIVQGISEFLPISSSGHLVVLYAILNITSNNILLSVIMHVATLMSILIVYRKDIIQLIKNPFCKTNKLLVCATIPTIVIVLVFKGLLDRLFTTTFVPFGFIITALLLISADFLSKTYNNKTQNIYNNTITNMGLTYKQVIFMGFVQGIACVPGISRSGSTISVGLLSNVQKEDVTNFSFLMSIPIIIASLMYELIFDGTNAILPFTIGQMIVGFVVAIIVGVFSIKLTKKITTKKYLHYMAYYLLIISAILIIK